MKKLFKYGELFFEGNSWDESKISDLHEEFNYGFVSDIFTQQHFKSELSFLFKSRKMQAEQAAYIIWFNENNLVKKFITCDDFISFASRIGKLDLKKIKVKELEL